MFKTIGKIILVILFFVFLLLSVISFSAYSVTTSKNVLPLLVSSLKADENLDQMISQLFLEAKNYFQQNPEGKNFSKGIEGNTITITRGDLSSGKERFEEKAVEKLASNFYYKERERSDIGNVFSASGNKLFSLATLISSILSLIFALGIIFAFDGWRRLTVLGICFLTAGLLWLPLSMFSSDGRTADFFDLIVLSFIGTLKTIYSILFIVGVGLVGGRILIPRVLKMK